MNVRSQRADERMTWLLLQMNEGHRRGFIIAWDEDFVDAFVDAFPEAEKSQKYYLIGANSVPMLNAAAKRAHNRGFIAPGSIGNMDARSYSQRTWCRTWNLTREGVWAADEAVLKSTAAQEGGEP